jgi:UDP-N-acetyl-2-amino-2-deoxyglucuronate dehydrogenase
MILRLLHATSIAKSNPGNGNKMRNETVRYALIGAGMGAETHAKEMAHVRGASLEAVYARSPQKAEQFRNRYGARKAYSDRAALLADPDIDAVIIVTPNGLHRDFAVAAAAAKKHVIVEKPLEITTARAREIIDACENHGVSLFVIYQMRFAEATATAKTAIDSGVLGRLILVNILDNEYRAPEYYARDYWRGTREFEGGGCLMTQTTHLLDLVQFLVGPVDSTFAHIRTAAHRIETEDLAVATLKFANGALGILSSSTAAFPAQRHILTVIGTDGTISINGEHDQIVYRGTRTNGTDIDAPEGFAFGDSPEPREFPTLRHRTQLQAITQRIFEGRNAGESEDDFLQALYLTDAIYRSAADGREVSLSEFRTLPRA